MGVLVLGLSALSGWSIRGAEVTLAWDPNVEADVAGYRIYYGTPAGTYNEQLDVGNVTSFTVGGLVEEQTYSFRATCYNVSGLESDPSNSVEYAVPVSVPVNELPVAQDQSISTPQDVPLMVVLSGVDADEDPLTFVVAVGPGHGTLSGESPELIYTPDSGYSGPDSFAFFANDGLGDSAWATVLISVTPMEDPTGPEPPLRITHTKVEEDGVIVTWASVAGGTYRLLYKSAPSDSEWLPLSEDLTATGSETSYVDRVVEAGVNWRYYVVVRVR
jgi:hypothetical protein